MFNCHCRDCQRASGSGYAAVVVLPKTMVRIIGELRYHRIIADSGRWIERGFCPNCGSQVSLFSELENLRRKRKGRVGRSCCVDETYIRVRGRWRYLYRAIDRGGALVDVMLSEHRDLAAARAFFRSARAVTGVMPARVTADGHDAYPRAIRTELGRQNRHRTSCCLNYRLEQDHRGIKGRCRPILGLKSDASAARFAAATTNSATFPLSIPDVPTCFCRDAPLAAHAKDGDCPPCLGDGPNVEARAATIVQPDGVNSDRTEQTAEQIIGNGERKLSQCANPRWIGSSTARCACINVCGILPG